ncbi:hypothetical protein [Dasania marina]
MSIATGYYVYLKNWVGLGWRAVYYHKPLARFGIGVTPVARHKLAAIVM